MCPRNGSEVSTSEETRCHYTSSWAMSVDIVCPYPRVRDLASGKDVVKYAMVATALAPDYVTKSQGKDEYRLEELQEDQPESKDIVMRADDIPEREGRKSWSPLGAMVSKKEMKIFRPRWKNINLQKRGRRVRHPRVKKAIPIQ